jgi:CheY-like chemotaxis protein
MIAAMPLSVLLVDDDADFRRLARHMLRGDGLVVVGEAETVAAALAVARELRPEAVLVDIGLPDGNGFELARQLSDLPWRPRIVLTSTDPDVATAEELQRSGAHAFVAKDDLPDAPLKRLLEGR